MKKLLKDLVDVNPELKECALGIPSLGHRSDGQDFSLDISNVLDAVYFVSRETKKMKIKKNLKKYSFSSGDSLKCEPFRPCIKEIKKVLKRKDLYSYPSASGNEEHKEKILDYLIREKFQKIGLNNIVFTMSTTHGYNLILETILRPYDVVIVPCPNYTFFNFVPERLSANCVLFELSKEDNWIINCEKLRKKIDEINNELKKKYKNLSYIPRVKALLNCNPSNPTGKSMGIKQIKILKELLNLAHEKDFYVIDDLVYQDICFDMSYKPVPLATLGKYFSNTITMMGLSKSYGLASIRAGIIVADELIIREITNKIFQTMDSYPVIQSAALAGAFNGSNKRYKYYNKYFRKINEEYKFRYNLVVALINGINAVSDKKIKNRILKFVNNKVDFIDIGIKEINLVDNCKPNAGFFTLLDMTSLKGKRYKDIVINNDKDLLTYFFVNRYVKFLIGSSFAYPEKDKLIARITFALEPEILVKSFIEINEAIKMLR